MSLSTVTPAALKAMLDDGDELALLDVREMGPFSLRHLFAAGPMPRGRLEERISALVPRRDTRVVLVDGGDGEAEMAGARLRAFGWSNVSVLAGGIEAWAKAGFELFSGVNVPSKAFGEFVEHHDHTPHLAAADLKARLDRGDDIVILDSRPLAEFERMSIPGAIDCPGAELVYRVHDLVRSPKTLVVVNCAGRTRSIIGAQSLINAGISNPVMALENGTMGWHLAGFTVDKGKTRKAPKPTANGLAWARRAAAAVARRFGVKTIGSEDLARLVAESDRRSLYRLDVRDPDDYVAGHRAGFRSAPGGQLVQTTDAFIGTRGSRVVLADDDSVRATMTASWLVQMGWTDVFVIDGPTGDLVRGPEDVEVLGLDAAVVDRIRPSDLVRSLERGDVGVVDVDASAAYRRAHIPGAWFALRSKLAEALATVTGRDLVFTSEDGRFAQLAAADARAIDPRPVKVLDGGTAAWIAAGQKVATGDERMASPPLDVWSRPYDRTEGLEAAMRQYLTWEVGLMEQLRREGDPGFRAFPKR